MKGRHIMKFLRIPILKNACEGLILLILISGLLEAEIMNKTYGGVEIKNIYECLFYFLIPYEQEPRDVCNFIISF